MDSLMVTAVVNVPIEKVWEAFTIPTHITHWNYASEDWHSPRAENDLRIGGRFSYRMESKDGKQGFDFTGTYDEVVPLKRIAYTMDGVDERKVVTEFGTEGDMTRVTTTFDAETVNPLEMQRAGWQAILDNFKRYAEGLAA